MNVSLKGEAEILLIPLDGRAMMSRKGLFRDAAVAQLGYDFRTFISNKNTGHAVRPQRAARWKKWDLSERIRTAQ